MLRLIEVFVDIMLQDRFYRDAAQLFNRKVFGLQKIDIKTNHMSLLAWLTARVHGCGGFID